MIRDTKASLAAAVLMGLICAGSGMAFGADAKAELIARQNQCLAETALDAEMECYDPTEALVLYDANTPREFDGAKAVRGNFVPVYESKNIKMVMSETHAEVVGKTGYTFGIVRMTGTDESGKPIDASWRTTNIWRKEGGVWKIVHEHNSFPADMTTGKADFQSK